MLMGCGVMTSAALMLFAASIKRLRYSTVGLMQYISPSLVFLTAVFIFGEPIDGWKLLSFVIIWLALAVFSFSALRDERGRRMEMEPGLDLRERPLIRRFAPPSPARGKGNIKGTSITTGNPGWPDRKPSFFLTGFFLPWRLAGIGRPLQRLSCMISSCAA